MKSDQFKHFFFFFENNDISENNQKCSTVPEAVCTKLTEHWSNFQQHYFSTRVKMNSEKSERESHDMFQINNEGTRKKGEVCFSVTESTTEFC